MGGSPGQWPQGMTPMGMVPGGDASATPMSWMGMTPCAPGTPGDPAAMAAAMQQMQDQMMQWNAMQQMMPGFGMPGSEKAGTPVLLPDGSWGMQNDRGQLL